MKRIATATIILLLGTILGVLLTRRNETVEPILADEALMPVAAVEAPASAKTTMDLDPPTEPTVEPASNEDPNHAVLTELLDRIAYLESEVRQLKSTSLRYEPFIKREEALLAAAQQRERDFNAWLGSLDPDAIDFEPSDIESTNLAVTEQTKLTEGQKLQVNYEGEWWAAEVVQLEDDGWVGVHYLGWSHEHDEVVPRSALQLDPDAMDKALDTEDARGNLEYIFEQANAGP